MDRAADLSPPVTPPSDFWLRRHRVRLLLAGAAIAVAAVSASAALVLLAKPVDTVEKMVPASADVMVLANLDPSVTQKLNLARALHRFPATQDDRAITDALDKALMDSGLRYSTDLKPWLGGELGVSARLNYDSSADSTGVVYAVSRDDTRAQAFLAKLRSVGVGKTMQWREEAYGGFTISVGTPSRTTDKAAAYSYVNHVAVIASSSAMIREVIDTEQGRAARLVESANYKATMSGLPGDRVGLAYVNGASIVVGIKKQLARAPSASKPIMANVADLDAFVGIGATLCAAPNGISADLRVKLDQSKLSPATSTALGNAGHPATVLTWIPNRSDAFIAVGNLNRSVQTLLDASKSDPSIVSSTNALGLTGPGGVLSHLTGDAAVEVQLGSGATPSGAILLATDDSRVLSAFFKKLLTLGSSLGPSLMLGSSPALRATAASVKTSTTTYRGVVITTTTSPSAALVIFAPAYAAVDGMGVLGSNLAAVEAVIDAHRGQDPISADPTYRAAMASSLARPNAVVYLNIGSLVDAVRRLATKNPSPAEIQALAAVAPIKAVTLTSMSQGDALLERVFLVID
ncbi:MAG: hypothetical protein PVSMB9_00370 [Candidatus Dormibacteria bacterium]